MQLIRQDKATSIRSSDPIFDGVVRTQNLVAEGDAELLRVTAVTFEQGARNRPHRHAADQVLVVTHGRGLVAGERATFHVGPGDVVLIPAGERHWHGAEPGEDFTHLSILTPGQITIDQ